jgi:hypothetical protein
VLGQGQLTTDNVIVQRLVATVIRRLSRQTVVPSRLSVVLSRFFAENHVFRLKITFFAWKSRFPAENRVHPPC